MTTTFQVKQFKHADFSEARIGISQVNDTLFAVVRNLPAGMDICPDVFRFKHAATAWARYSRECIALEAIGFRCTQTTGN